MKEKQRWVVVVIYAAAMAWVESAAVIYLRSLISRLQPYQPSPLAMSAGSNLVWVEAVREAATLTMLLTVGWLAGRNGRCRLAYAMIAFGVWDILYYVFLAVIGPWPRSIMDWDVLFLLPLPWWGPVLAPVAISILLILSGTLVSQYDRDDQPLWPARGAQWTCLAGVILALAVFMSDALLTIFAGQGGQALGDVLPTKFNWPLFLVALGLMSAPAIDLIRRIRLTPRV